MLDLTMNIKEKEIFKAIKLKEKKRLYYIKHKERIKAYRQEHKEEIKIYRKKYQLEHKEEIKKRDNEYHKKHNQEYKERSKKHYQKHKEIHKEYRKKYQKEHKKEINEYMKNRRKTNINFKIGCYLRSRVYLALKGNPKLSTTIKLLGCSIKFLKGYLASKFTKGMNWDNYGKWHIDHIRPCSSYDLSKPEEQSLCFNYINLQPLWAKDNLEKHDKEKIGGKND